LATLAVFFAAAEASASFSAPPTASQRTTKRPKAATVLNVLA
jgi:hypothetical protein